MKISGKLLCFLSALIFILVATYAATRLLTIKNEGVMVCSTKGIMRFENMEDENVNGNIHFHLVLMVKARLLLKVIPLQKRDGCIYNVM